MIYPIQQAIGRNQVLHYACQQAVDRAMRRSHDRFGLGPVLVPETSAEEFADHMLAESTAVFHRRMRTDPTRCRWCGVAAREARAELEENEDG